MLGAKACGCNWRGSTKKARELDVRGECDEDDEDATTQQQKIFLNIMTIPTVCFALPC